MNESSEDKRLTHNSNNNIDQHRHVDYNQSTHNNDTTDLLSDTADSYHTAELYSDEVHSPISDGYNTAMSIQSIDNDHTQQDDVYNTESTPTHKSTAESGELTAADSSSITDTAAEQFFQQFSLESILKQKSDSHELLRQQLHANIQSELDLQFPSVNHSNDELLHTVHELIESGTVNPIDHDHVNSDNHQHTPNDTYSTLSTVDELADDHKLFNSLATGNNELSYHHSMIVLGQDSLNIHHDAYKLYKQHQDNRQQYIDTNQFHDIFADDILHDKQSNEAIQQKYDDIQRLRRSVIDHHEQNIDDTGNTTNLDTTHLVTVAQLTDTELYNLQLEYEYNRLTTMEYKLQQNIQYQSQLYIYEHSQRVGVTQQYYQYKSHLDKLLELYKHKKLQFIQNETIRYQQMESAMLQKLQKLHNATVVDQLIDNKDDSTQSAEDSCTDPLTHVLTLPSKQYRIYDIHTPRILRVRIDYLRGLRNKVQPGNYVIQCTLYNRLNGDPLRYSNKIHSTVTPISQYHSGHYYSTELCYNNNINNRIYMTLPSISQSNPYLCLLFECYYVGNLQPGINHTTDNITIDNTMHCIGWCVMPCMRSDQSIVQGQYVLPMCKGTYNTLINHTYRSLHTQMTTTLESWLGNLYFDCKQYTQYVDYENCDYVQFHHHDDVAQPIDPHHQTGPEYESDNDDSDNESTQLLSGDECNTAALTPSTNPFQYELESISNEDIVPYQTDLNTFNSYCTISHDVYSTQSMNVHTISQQSDKLVKESMVDDILNDAHRNKRNRALLLHTYQINIAPANHDGTDNQLSAIQKYRYVQYELYELCSNNNIYMTLVVLCLSMWLRVYTHYAGIILYTLATMPHVTYTVMPYTVIIDYTNTVLSGSSGSAIISISCLSTWIVFVVLSILVYLLQLVLKSSPQFFSQSILIYGIVTIVDPLAVLFIDVITQNWVTGDAFLLYNIYTTIPMKLVAVLWTIFIYVLYMTISTLTVYTYTLYVYRSQCIIDHYSRLNNHTNYVPSDNEWSLNELHSIMNTYTAVQHDKKYKLHMNEFQHTDGYTVHYIAVFVLLNEEEQELDRQFILYDDGTVIELLDMVVQYTTMDALHTAVYDIINNTNRHQKYMLYQTQEQINQRRTLLHDTVKQLQSSVKPAPSTDNNSYVAKTRRLHEQQIAQSVAPKIDTIDLDELLAT